MPLQGRIHKLNHLIWGNVIKRNAFAHDQTLLKRAHTGSPSRYSGSETIARRPLCHAAGRARQFGQDVVHSVGRDLLGVPDQRGWPRIKPLSP